MGAGIALHHRRCGRGMDCSRRSDRTSAGCRRVFRRGLDDARDVSLYCADFADCAGIGRAASLWIAPHLQMPVYALAYAVIVGGILQLAVQIPALARLRMLPKIGMNPLKALAHRGVKRILMKMAPAAFAVSVSQLSLIINTNIASRLAPGSVTWLSYADRLMEFPSALLGVALGTVLLP